VTVTYIRHYCIHTVYIEYAGVNNPGKSMKDPRVPTVGSSNTGMSVETVSAVVKIKTVKELFITHKLSAG
jgi:hypothetical protein